MTDDRNSVWRRNEPDSPCQAVCLIDPTTRLCLGCNRTADEIAAWPRMTRDERIALMAELPDRSPTAGKRRGGRAGRVPNRNKLRE